MAQPEQKMHVKSCAGCGTQLPTGAVFCLKCGLKQAPKSANKLYGEAVYYKDIRGKTFEAMGKCPNCERITPMGKVDHHLQRPGLALAGLVTGGMAWLGMVLPAHHMVCRICGYKH